MKSSKIRYRVMARLIDLIVCFVAIIITLFFTKTSEMVELIIEGSSATLDLPKLFSLLQAGFIIILFMIVYGAFIPTYTHGRTLGAYLFKIHIVNDDGSNCSFLQMFLRKTISEDTLLIFTMGLSEILSLLLILYRHDRLSISDIFSHTRVVDYTEKE